MYFSSGSFRGLGTMIVTGLAACAIVGVEAVAVLIWGVFWLFHHVSFH